MAAAVYEYNPNDGYVAVVTAYAESLRDEPELLSGYHAFQVFVGTVGRHDPAADRLLAAGPIDRRCVPRRASRDAA